MSLTYREHAGLIVANEAMDERSVSLSLKRLDRRFVLQKHPREGVEGGFVWKVVCFVSDTYAPVVLTWMDEHGRPLPLSSALVDEMQRHMVGSRGKVESADDYNTRLVAERKRQADDQQKAIIEDHRPYVERNRVGVSISTSKKLPYWQREGRPKSGQA